MSSFSSATHSTLVYKMASRGCLSDYTQKKKYLKNQILGGKGWQSRQLQICYKIKRGMVKIYQKRREQRRKNPPHPCCLQQKVAHIYFVPATCYFFSCKAARGVDIQECRLCTPTEWRGAYFWVNLAKQKPTGGKKNIGGVEEGQREKKGEGFKLLTKGGMERKIDQERNCSFNEMQIPGPDGKHTFWERGRSKKKKEGKKGKKKREQANQAHWQHEDEQAVFFLLTSQMIYYIHTITAFRRIRVSKYYYWCLVF